jgi:ribonucleoside-diphosphate reductase alpha chain
MTAIHVKKRNGRLEILDVDKINKVVTRACQGLENVSPSEVVIDAKLQVYDKIPTVEIDKALMMTARSKIEKEPEYSYLSAHLLLNSLYKEVFGEGVDADTFELLYRKAFIKNTKAMVKEGRLSKSLLDFDLKLLAEKLDLNRDNLFKYHGMQIVYDRYLLQFEGRRMETPQAFWMRVAMGLAINEGAMKNERAVEFYDLLSQFNGCSSTPTLFNSGTTHSQLSSCYLNTFDDSIDGIFDGLWQEARKSKYAGGLGIDATPFRATGSFINGTNGSSSGLIPWLKLFNDMLVGVNQGGRRPGSGCAYLEPWHLDVEDFIDLRKTTGEERRRTHDMNTALWVCDLFMQRVKDDGDWYLFCPSYASHLHELYGEAFNEAYLALSEKAEKGEIKLFKKIKAKDLWKKALKSIFETSHPWITFKDPCNLRYANKHEGVIHSSNLCTEITLHTLASEYENGVKVKVGETAVCNLASVNLARHVVNNEIDW